MRYLALLVLLILPQVGRSSELDSMALRTARELKDFRMVCIWPRVPYSDEQKILEFINNHGTCFYHKKITLLNDGPLKLLYRIPDKRPRYRKVLPKFFFVDRNVHHMMCFLIQIEDIWDGRHIKRDVRAYYQIGQYSIHISDTHEQSLDLAELFLDDDALEEFNHSKFTEE